jgi:excinuclease ABC subunit C
MRFTPKSIDKLPEASGVYLFRDQNNFILYVGKAKNLKRRVSSYFNGRETDSKTDSLTPLVATISIIEVQSEFEALLLEAKLIKKLKPKYNIAWKDDKHYIYIKITAEKFPRILLARRHDDVKSLFFGPFPSTTAVRDILSFLRRIFPYCNQKRNIKRACFYTHIGLCSPCPGVIMNAKDKEYDEMHLEYLANIRQIKLILSGKSQKVKIYLLKSMKFYAKRNEFEKAALYKSKLANLLYLVNDYHPPQSYIENPNLSKSLFQKETSELLLLLTPYFPKLGKMVDEEKSKLRIECYDISNISGKQAAGSMVTFIGGKSDKRYYRHFRIRLKNTPDDFAMLQEVMRRRLSHPEWKLPDLFVIDGGKPQLLALKKILANFGVDTPLIGLAKEYEELIVCHDESFTRIRLPRASAALHLTQRLRDEAHRFAHRYFEMLRLKNLYALSA